MSDLKSRLLPGFIFVITTVACMLLGGYYLFAYVLIALTLSLLEMKSIISRLGGKPSLFPFFVAGYFALVLFALNKFTDFHANMYYYQFLILILMSVELFRKPQKPTLNVLSYCIVLVYLGMGFTSMLNVANIDNSTFDGSTLLCIIIINWMNDTGAWFWGRRFGKHKLIEHVSPNKTIEGTVGGAITAILTSLAINYITSSHDFLLWLAIAITIVIFGSLGDLFESLLKRKANIKDSGKLLGGHGGIIDRFDSLLFAVPAVYFILNIVNQL
ncbi:MAG: phosphatidate cytidylyltransferase [Bacteroidales bacterium]